MLSKTVQNSSWYRIHSEFLVKIWRIRPDSVARQSVSQFQSFWPRVTSKTNKQTTKNELVIETIIVIVYYLTLYFYDQEEFEFFVLFKYSANSRTSQLAFFSQGGEPKRSILLSSLAKDNDHRRGFVKKIKSMHCMTTRKKGREW